MTPDYVLVPTAIASDFKSAMQKAYASFFPTDPLGPDSPWSKIVNDVQYKRLMNLILSTKGTVLAGGVGDFRRRIATTIVGDVKLDDPLMEEYVCFILTSRNALTIMFINQGTVWSYSSYCRG